MKPKKKKPASSASKSPSNPLPLPGVDIDISRVREAEPDPGHLPIPTRMGPGEIPLSKENFQCPFHLMWRDYDDKLNFQP